MIPRRVLLASALAAPPPGAKTGAPETGELIADVTTFGAKGDGVTDDSQAINEAVRFLRKNQHGIGHFTVAPRLVFPTRSYAVANSIDLTNLQDINLLVEGRGSVIVGRCPGLPVIDALGSRWLTMRDLTVIGDAVAAPKLGLQIGLSQRDRVADDHRFENLKILGSYQLACLLNLSAETTGFDHVMLWNDFPAENSYCLIQDGLDHFATLSAFADAKGQITDRDNSFNENEFINCDFRHGGGGVPVWLGDTARHRFIRCYAATNGPTAFVLHCGPNSHTMLDIDCHCETSTLKQVFLITSSSPTPVIRGFGYKDHESFAAEAVFRGDTPIHKVTLQNAHIDIASFFHPSCKLFDDPQHWSVTGSYYSSTIAAWNGAECFSGTVQLGNEMVFAGLVGTKVPAGPTQRRPAGLLMTDSGRMFLDLTLNQLIVWSGKNWMNASGGRV